MQVRPQNNATTFQQGSIFSINDLVLRIKKEEVHTELKLFGKDGNISKGNK